METIISVPWGTCGSFNSCPFMRCSKCAMKSDKRERSGGEDIPYDPLVSLPYLDTICKENSSPVNGATSRMFEWWHSRVETNNNNTISRYPPAQWLLIPIKTYWTLFTLSSPMKAYFRQGGEASAPEAPKLCQSPQMLENSEAVRSQVSVLLTFFFVRTWLGGKEIGVLKIRMITFPCPIRAANSSFPFQVVDMHASSRHIFRRIYCEKFLSI